jgi:hypothetical protein
MFNASNRSRFEHPSSKIFHTFSKNLIKSNSLADYANKDKAQLELTKSDFSKVTKIDPVLSEDKIKAISFLLTLESGKRVEAKKAVDKAKPINLPAWVFRHSHKLSK